VESKRRPQDFDRDERLAIPLDPETALRGLLQVQPEPEPESEPAERKRAEKPEPGR
jgi:hypothetical protein